MDIIKRFLNYVSFETTSNDESDTCPSSDKEILLLKELQKELIEIGLDSVYKDGYTYGKIKSDCNKKDTIFLMAHVDTAPDASGKDIKPRKVKYTGEDIVLNERRTLSEKQFPMLKNHRGNELIVTDGNTLLGADDKAGVAIIMDTIEKALKRGNYPNIIVCFTPDEEIGRGTLHIDTDYIKEGTTKIYAYTLDGDDCRAFNYECFNANQAKVEIEGTSVHPSIGKNKLVNAQEVFMEFHALLPLERPENSEGREPFIHLTNSLGSVENGTYTYIIRNFDRKDLERQNESFYKARDIINNKYHKDIVKVTIKEQYRNMIEVINKYPYSVDLCHKAYKELDIPCFDMPIRGGTDGATLSFKGIPCPNLGTGGGNFHGPYEYLDINQMKTMVTIVTKIMDLLD